MVKRKALAPRRVTSQEAEERSFAVRNGKEVEAGRTEVQDETAQEPPRKRARVYSETTNYPKPSNLFYPLCTLRLSCDPTNTETQKLIRTQQFLIQYSLSSTSDSLHSEFRVLLCHKESSHPLTTLKFTKRAILSATTSFGDAMSLPTNKTVYAIAKSMIQQNPIVYLHFTQNDRFDEIETQICLFQDSFTENNIHWNSLDKRETTRQTNLREIIAWIFPGSTNELLLNNSESLTKVDDEFNPLLLYKRIAPSGLEKTLPQSPPLLNVKLRNYQNRAANWMVERERLHNAEFRNVLWKPLKSKSLLFYYNPYSALLSHTKPVIPSEIRGGILADEMGLGKTIELLACILSHPNDTLEEQRKIYQEQLRKSMGDKKPHSSEEPKTLKCYCRSLELTEHQTILQCKKCMTWQHKLCVGFTPCMDEDIYFCPDCSFHSQCTIPSNTTLIICPTAILQQWRHEIVRRTSLTAFKLLIYEGITNPNRQNQLSETGKRKRDKIVLPQHLTQYDIVLTTYDTLRGDLHHSKIHPSDPSTPKRANRVKKYRSLPTPLTGVNWWRVCVDEAQMVSSSTAKAAEMALQLQAQHRWCISGTPIQRKGLYDLQGLFMFLQIPLLGDLHTFRKLIAQPMEYKELFDTTLDHLVELTKPILWRSSKEDVKDELCIPPQGEKIHLLRFTPVESHFYKKQHQACSEATVNAMIRSRENRLTPKQESALLNSLLRLRQACCHPQIGNHSVGIQIQRTPLTMEQLLDQLILKAKIECEEAQRQWIVATSALAALKILSSSEHQSPQPAIEAAELYREMIRTANENKKANIDVDAIQLLHLYHNLSALLGFVPTDSAGKYSKEIMAAQGQSLMDTELCNRVKEIRESYSLKNKQFMLQNTQALHESNQRVEKLISSVEEQEIPWWEEFCGAKQLQNSSSEILEKLRDALINVNGRFPSYRAHPHSLASRFYSLAQLQLLLKAEIITLHKQREQVLILMKENEPKENQELLEQVAEVIACPCRDSGLNNTKQTCHSCKIFKEIVKMEQMLYFDSTLQNINASSQTDGLSRTKHDGDLIILLHAFVRFIPNYLDKESSQKMVAQVKRDIDIIRAIAKESKRVRQLWESHRNYLLAIDELQQATTRIRLQWEGEEVADSEKHYKIKPYEIEPLIQKYSSQRKSFGILLSEKKGQLKYLSNLDGKKNLMNEDHSEKECIICRELMGDHLVILACGHEFCGSCVTSLIVRSHGTLKCPTCRTRMNSDEIAYISDQPVERITHSQDKSSQMQVDTEIGNEDTPAISVIGSWGTKIEAIVRELLRIKQTDAKAKSLVFSQWNEVLDLLAQALEQNNISAVQLGSANKKKQDTALHSYRFISSISVLLLPLKKGANGLNLTEATHVFLVEPLLNPGTEAQAIGRIHRFGQTQSTTVHRFIVESTVEEKLHAINCKRKEKQIEECFDAEWKLHKSEKACMTKDALCEIFGITEETLGEVTAVDESPLHFPQPVVDRFWNTLVHWEGRTLSRHAVATQLESRYSLRLLNSNGRTPQRTCNLYSVNLPHSIAKAIMKLKEFHDDEEAEENELDSHGSP